MLLKLTPLRIVINGHAAVIMFFVLSGYVLQRAFLAASAGGYWAFARQRLVRLWLPFAFAVLLGAGLLWLFGPAPIPQVNADFSQGVWQAPATPLRVLGGLALTGRADDLLMDPPLWSLVHEVRISLLFPLIAVFVARRPLVWLAGALVLHFVCSRLSPNVLSPTIADSVIQSGAYVVFFIAGFVLARHAETVGRWIGRTARPVAAPVAPAPPLEERAAL